MNTNFTSNNCKICNTTKITFDQHYGLPKCFDFILVCPEHPGELFFDLSNEEINELIDSE